MLFLAARLRLGHEHHDHQAPVQSRSPFDGGDVGQLPGHVVQLLAAQLGVRDLSRAELTGYLNLVSFFKELAGLARLKSQIVLRNTRADLDPLDVLLLLFGLALPMLLLILVLAEVNDSPSSRAWFSAWRV
jgi:hypothetical protein